MKLRVTLGSLGLAATLAGCSSAGYELNTANELVREYGGEVAVKSGYNFGTSAGQVRGRYLELTLANPAIIRHYPDLTIPASRCAYLAYHNLTAEPDRYATYKVNLLDSVAHAHTFVFAATDLARAELAATNLTALVADWQQHELLDAVGTCAPAVFTTTPADSLLPLMTRLAQHLAPLENYYIQGWRPQTDTIAKQPVQVMQLLVQVPHPAPRPDGVFTVFINPDLRPNQKFLYGIRMLQ